MNVKIQNKNLAYMKDGSTSWGNNSFVIANNVLSINSSGSGSNSYINPVDNSRATWAPVYSNVEDKHLTPNGEDYTITVYTNKKYSGAIQFYVYTNLRNKAERIENNNSTTISISLATDEHIKSYGIWVDQSNTFSDYQVRVQIEKGLATSYVAHAEQNLPFTLLSGQNLMEGGYLASDGVHNVRKQKIINGTENISVFEYGTAHINTNMFKVGTIIDATVNMISKCSHFPVKLNTVGTLNTDTNWVINDIHGSVYFSIDKNLANTVEEFRTWLSTNNVLIEYTSTAPTTTAYTSTQQAQYNAIKNAISYNEQTNISSTSTDLSADLEAVAIADMNAVFQTLQSRVDLLEG